MVRANRPFIVAGALGATVLAFALMPGVAAACAIDNTASLFVGGVQATSNTAAPTGTGLWAKFTIDKAFASGTPVQFGEARNELARTLSPATLAAPYRWVFGDGSAALGHTPSHRYARAGTYRLEVYGFSKATKSWFPFDQALVRIVPPDQVLQANLGYYALRAFDVVMSGVMWLIDALIVAFVGYVVIKRRRARRTAPAGTTAEATLPAIAARSARPDRDREAPTLSRD